MHYYRVTRWLAGGQFQRQRMCDRQWTEDKDKEMTTQQRRVTCPKCLDILIPRAEDNLAIMKHNRKSGIGKS